MKNTLIKKSALIIICASLITLCGCNTNNEPVIYTENGSYPNSAVVEPTKNTKLDNQSTTDFDVSTLHTFPIISSDPFSGIWKITEGVGSQLENFVFAFDGQKTGTMLVGSMCYCSEYKFETQNNKNVFTCQFLFGISGSYTYEIKENSIVLKNIVDGETTTLERADSFKPAPAPMENYKIDEKLIGAWRNSTGIYYYFGTNGIMYNNNYGSMYSYYAYTAENGVINSKYTMTEEIEQKMEYSVKKDELTLDGDTYTRIALNELI